MPDISLGPVTRGSADLRAYLARPTGDGPWPAVVALHETVGLDDVLRRQCDRLAAAGYLTIGPDLFSDGGARRCVVATLRAMVRGTGKPYADIEAARRYLTRVGRLHRQGRRDRVLHGRRVRAGASRRAGFDVAADNYGVVPAQAAAGAGRRLPDRGQLPEARPADVGPGEQAAPALDELGVEHDVKVYPGAGPLVPQRRPERARGCCGRC